MSIRKKDIFSLISKMNKKIKNNIQKIKLKIFICLLRKNKNRIYPIL
jgi:hypothetical protein